jgi:hypothetical protein
LGCKAASLFVVLRGISQVMGSVEFNRRIDRAFLFWDESGRVIRSRYVGQADWDWVPGDWGGVVNTKWDGKPGREGETLIYMGMGLWWGFGTQMPMRSLWGQDGWLNEVRRWNGGAKIGDRRNYPILGLDRDPDYR